MSSLLMKLLFLFSILWVVISTEGVPQNGVVAPGQPPAEESDDIKCGSEAYGDWGDDVCICPTDGWTKDICNLGCEGKQKCKGFELKCSKLNRDDCNANCDGDQACGDAYIKGKGAEDLKVNCVRGNQVCKGAWVDCKVTKDCEVRCGGGKQACQDLYIQGSNAGDDVKLYCDGSKGADMVCDNVRVECSSHPLEGPEDERKCKITCSGTYDACDGVRVTKDPLGICKCVEKDGGKCPKDICKVSNGDGDGKGGNSGDGKGGNEGKGGKGGDDDDKDKTSGSKRSRSKSSSSSGSKSGSGRGRGGKGDDDDKDNEGGSDKGSNGKGDGKDGNKDKGGGSDKDGKDGGDGKGGKGGDDKGKRSGSESGSESGSKSGSGSGKGRGDRGDGRDGNKDNGGGDKGDSSCTPKYGQCGGKSFKGTKCCDGYVCKYQTEWYSQCKEDSNKGMSAKVNQYQRTDRGDGKDGGDDKRRRSGPRSRSSSSSRSRSKSGSASGRGRSGGDRGDGDKDRSDKGYSSYKYSRQSALSEDSHIIGEDIDDNNSDHITLSLSKTSTINLWAIISLFALVNVALYVCYNKKTKYSFDDNKHQQPQQQEIYIEE